MLKGQILLKKNTNEVTSKMSAKLILTLPTELSSAETTAANVLLSKLSIFLNLLTSSEGAWIG